jgi:hypothetical protein
MQPSYGFKPLHIRQIYIKDYDVEIVVLGEIDGVLAGLCRLADDALALQGGIDHLGRDRVNFHNQSTHTDQSWRQRVELFAGENPDVKVRGIAVCEPHAVARALPRVLGQRFGWQRPYKLE